jgi:hypothetical protein
MGLIDRFTRDTASKYVWAVLALVAAGGLVFAITYGARALDEERADAQARAVLYVQDALVPRIAGEALVAPITGPQAASLDTAIQRTVLVDDRLSRVRIWSADGQLLYSTDGADALGSNGGLNDPLLREASRDGVLTRSNVSDTGGQNDPERSLLRTYVPVGARAVVEIDQTDEATLAAVRTEWWYYQLLAGAMLLLLLVMTGLSLRDPIEPINVGVPFAASSIPAGFSLIDNERLHAVEEVYRLASERVGRLKEKLDESETARRRLEGDVQRALSKVGSSSPRAAAPVPPPAAASTPPPVIAPEPPPVVVPPPVVRVPESDVVPAPLGDAWTAAPAGPLARASRDQKPPPETARRAKPATPRPKKTPKRQKAKKEQPVEPQREAAPPRPAKTPERRPAAVGAAAAAASPRPVVIDPEVDDAKAHEAALETFIRLTESDRQPHDTSTVDQGAVRAALARTAARKKPGGERLQSHEGPPEESPNGPPRGD